MTPNRYWLKLIKHHNILLWTPLLGFRISRKWPDHSFSGPHDKTAKIKIYPWPFLPSGKPFNFTVAFTPGKFMKWHLLMFNSFLTPVALQLIVPFQWIYYNKDLFCDSQFEWIQSIVICLLQLKKKEGIWWELPHLPLSHKCWHNLFQFNFTTCGGSKAKWLGRRT